MIGGKIQYSNLQYVGTYSRKQYWVLFQLMDLDIKSLLMDYLLNSINQITATSSGGGGTNVPYRLTLCLYNANTTLLRFRNHNLGGIAIWDE